MVISWVGDSLARLIEHVQPQGSAKYLQFVTAARADEMPGLRYKVLGWIYTEALRMDEAMHPLALLTFGMYGQVLPNQNGVPVGVVLPWKYGFKSAKSIVRIHFVEKQPTTAWNVAVPREYVFYANVSHPRWSQATERRIGEPGGLFARKRLTLMFNGYEPEVGQLYAGMDLQEFYRSRCVRCYLAGRPNRWCSCCACGRWRRCSGACSLTGWAQIRPRP